MISKKYLFLFLCVWGALSATAQTISTIAGDGNYGFFGDGGPATASRFQYIWYVAPGEANSVYFTDNSNHRIRKVSASGIITTAAGNGSPAYTGDGGPATTASIAGVSGITADTAGNIYFADVSNHRVRKINTSGIVTTIAGTGTAGYLGDGGPATAARLSAPYGIVADMAGNIYIGDAGNNRIRMISAAGTISTVAGTGTGGFGGDGGAATAAQLSSPAGVALDIQGNLYVADVLNNRVRMVSPAGTITTVAGRGTSGYSGDGGAATGARLDQPLSIAVDGGGNIYISDQFNNRIRKVDVWGDITTLAGNGTAAYGGDGGPASAAMLNRPFGVAIDSFGDLYFSDWGNYRVRKIAFANHIPTFVSGSFDSAALCEGTNVDISSLLRVNDADTAQVLTWKVLTGAMHGTIAASYTTTASAGIVSPAGITYTPVPGYSGMDTFIVKVDDGHSLDTITISVRVKPLPPIGPISGTAIVCIGVPATMLNSVAGGAWSIAGSGTVATIDGSGVVNGVGEGIDTVFYSTTVAGCSSVVSHTINVYATSVTLTGPSAVCFDRTVTLNATPAGGTWTASNGVAFVSATGDVYGVTAGVDTIIYSVTNPCGTFTNQKQIIVNDMIAPVVVITGSPGAFILPGQSDTLFANIISGGGIIYDYQWQLNGSNIPGATNNFYISDTLRTHDSVTCIVTNGPCAASSFGWIYIVYLSEHVGVGDIDNEVVFVSPNPANRTFTIRGWLLTDEKTTTIELTDMLGRVLLQENSPVESGAFKHQVTLHDQVPDGIYMLRVSSGSRQKVVRLVLSR